VPALLPRRCFREDGVATLGSAWDSAPPSAFRVRYRRFRERGMVRPRVSLGQPSRARRRRRPFVYLKGAGFAVSRARVHGTWERHAAAPPCAWRNARFLRRLSPALSLSLSLFLSVGSLMPRVCPSHESACGWAADATTCARPLRGMASRDARENRAPFCLYVCAHLGTRASARVPVPRRETGWTQEEPTRP